MGRIGRPAVCSVIAANLANVITARQKASGENNAVAHQQTLTHLGRGTPGGHKPQRRSQPLARQLRAIPRQQPLGLSASGRTSENGDACGHSMRWFEDGGWNWIAVGLLGRRLRGAFRQLRQRALQRILADGRVLSRNTGQGRGGQVHVFGRSRDAGTRQLAEKWTSPRPVNGYPKSIDARTTIFPQEGGLGGWDDTAAVGQSKNQRQAP